MRAVVRILCMIINLSLLNRYKVRTIDISGAIPLLHFKYLPMIAGYLGQAALS